MMSRGPIDEPSSVDWDKEWKKVSSQAPVPEQKEVVEEEEVAVPLPKADRPKGMDGMNELERNTVRATRRVAGLVRAGSRLMTEFLQRPPSQPFYSHALLFATSGEGSRAQRRGYCREGEEDQGNMSTSFAREAPRQ
uniref:Uncharacterized protein n=2 Tax=Phaeomonas parva TaxID=124430 RepID=A0A6U4CN04_9STRA